MREVAYDILANMTKLLERAIEKIKELSEIEQNEAAEGLITYVGLVKEVEYRLTSEQVVGVEKARAAMKRGEFAKDEDIAAIRHRAGL